MATGNMFYQATDYTTAGENPLAYIRYYNSRGANLLPVGANWRSNFTPYMIFPDSSLAVLYQADGRIINFTESGGTWSGGSDVALTYATSGSDFTVTDTNDTTETYNSSGQLLSRKYRNGYKQTLSYNSSGQLTSVTDSYNRTLTFTYNSTGTIASVETPDSTTINYGYTASSAGSNLTSVTYPTSPSTSLTYAYSSTAPYNALTEVIDENNNEYLSWTYDSLGRALTSTQGNGSTANTTTFSYNDASQTTTVTNSLGVADTYSFTNLVNMPKVSSISRAATSTTAAASRTFGYDTNGYMSSKTDWNGNSTTYVNNANGQPTTINEAVGSSVARTTTIAYDTTWVHLPDTITTPGLTIGFTYDSDGNQLTKKLTDTTTTTTPYSTSGQTRTWTNTWSNYLLASVETPNSHTTSFGHDSTGALTSITDPLSHETTISSHTGGGLPETIVDPNGVTTTDSYDPRQRITSSSVSTSAGALDTTWTYYNFGDVTTTLPDNSELTTVLDSAHRLYALSDYYNEQTDWPLDTNGDPVATLKFDRNGNIDFWRNATYDALGRKLKDTSTVTGASYVWTYDKNGNPLTVADPLSHTTTNVFDALNRVSTSTDANTGVVTLTYDAHNRPLTVKDKNGHTTSYVYDGFGDVIQQTSPDSGTTVYHYDSDGNLTSRTDAASVVTDWTYDALDRPLTTTYPADSTENVAYTYDQTGHGFGIGRLTSLTDASGSLSRTYDALGNILTEVRINGTNTLTTTYTYDKANRVASITYPSGSLVTYTRDSVGRPITVAAKAPGATSVNLASSITYEPYGPVTGVTAFNGDAEAFTFDADYRMTSLITTATNGGQHQTYTYDNANNLKTLTDTLCTTCTGSYSYDVLNRLTSASGWYGTYGYSYDKNGNTLTNGEDGYNATYTIASGSNHISSIAVSGSSYPVSYTATGNMSTVTRIPGETVNLTYNKNNRLATTSTYWASATYGYDAFGQRITKADSGTEPTLYSYDHSGNTLEENDNGVLYDYIWLGGRLIGTLTPATNILAFTHGDRLGSPNDATDKNALVSQSFVYTPYGNLSGTYVQTGAQTITQNNRQPGQFFDPETLMNHNGFRDYSTQLSGYVESDPIGLSGGLNTYAYVGGNPLIFTDRQGLELSYQERIEMGELYENTGKILIGLGGIISIFPPGQVVGLPMMTAGVMCDAEGKVISPSPDMSPLATTVNLISDYMSDESWLYQLMWGTEQIGQGAFPGLFSGTLPPQPASEPSTNNPTSPWQPSECSTGGGITICTRVSPVHPVQ